MDGLTNGPDTIELVRKAQLGYEQSLDRLAEAAEARLFAYIYRLTLNNDLTEDLVQDTLLKMVESLRELKQPERFWCWLFRTALGKVQHHFRDRRRQWDVQMAAFSKERLNEYEDDGLSRLVRSELSGAVLEGIARLKLSYRNVLLLRCYERMSFAEIAEAVGCKELGARVLFYRAKRSLGRELAWRGFDRTMLVPAIGLFGAMTTRTGTAAGSATAPALSVGAFAAFVATITSRVAVALTGTAGVLLSLSGRHLAMLALLLFFALFCFVVALYCD